MYIFLDELGRALYVGEATGQSLEKRIRQNYTEDSGGTFRDNFAKKSGKNAGDGEKNICIFKRALNENKWKIVAICVPKRNDQAPTRNEKRWIHTLESAIIGLLDPCYNMN